MSGARHGVKGKRVELQICALHKALGIHAERYPNSGSSPGAHGGSDIDLYLDGRDEAPLVGEVKARKGGEGFKTLASWLGENDLLFLRRDGEPEPLVVLPWSTWSRLVTRRRAAC